MVEYTDTNGDLDGTLIEKAVEYFKSGKVNFSVINSEGQDVLAARIIEIDDAKSGPFAHRNRRFLRGSSEAAYLEISKRTRYM